VKNTASHLPLNIKGGEEEVETIMPENQPHFSFASFNIAVDFRQ